MMTGVRLLDNMVDDSVDDDREDKQGPPPNTLTLYVMISFFRPINIHSQYMLIV